MMPDLELLRLFLLLLRERNLTRAARAAGIGQPGMSRALARMRASFDDPLFVRSPQGMLPTPRALELEPAVSDLLARAAALQRPARFEPATLERTFYLGMNDFIEADLAARLAIRLAEEAPRVNLALRPLGEGLWDALASGRMDLAFSTRPTLPPEVIAQHLFEDGFKCVVRRGHPRVKRRLTLSLFTELSHVLIAPRGEPGSAVDTALAARGMSRRVAVRTHSFLSAPHIVAETDLVLTGPRRVLEPMARRFRLAIFDPPLPLSGFSIFQAWHPRVDSDPIHIWLRGLVAQVARRRSSA